MITWLITQNTDTVDIGDKCIGLDCRHESIPHDLVDHLYENRGLHVQIRHNGNPQTFVDANHVARLFAAAPDLLKALEQITEMTSRYVAGDESHHYEITEARRAILKAKGTPSL